MSTIIDDKLLDNLLSQAKASPRLRVSFDLRDSWKKRARVTPRTKAGLSPDIFFILTP